MSVFLHACAPRECNACGGQRRASDTLKLELQRFVNCQMWILETKLSFPATIYTQCKSLSLKFQLTWVILVFRVTTQVRNGWVDVCHLNRVFQTSLHITKITSIPANRV